jgi:hypothetical protein
VFFVDENGQTLPGEFEAARLFRWGGSFNWTPQQAVFDVPPAAVRAVFQIGKLDANGTLQVDDIRIAGAPDPHATSWRPYHERQDVEDWEPYVPKPAIEAGSALDASTLVERPAGKHGRVLVKDGRLHFEDGRRARFFGVAMLPPLAFMPAERADALADRLARSGVNLVRLGDLDLPYGPGLCMFDDSRDDTKALDAMAITKLDHLIGALKARGIYIALEIQSGRRFRENDGLPDVEHLPPGGGAAAAFDPAIRDLAIRAAALLLGHVNPETGQTLRDDPVLAWITLAGELSLFDVPDDPRSLSATESDVLKKLAAKSSVGTGRRFWLVTEAAQWKAEADALRKLGVRVPIAGCSHWRHDPSEFCAAQNGAGLDLVDDRLYWTPPPLGGPDRRAALWDPAGNAAAVAEKKRRADRPFAAGQWCSHSEGAWALPHDGADMIYGAKLAALEDWDALVRRGVYMYPQVWGSAAPGTGGGDDRFVAPEIVNGNPAIFSLLPHVASIFLRGHVDGAARRAEPAGRGRVVVDTPYTQALAGWPRGRPAVSDALSIATENPYAVIAVSSLDKDPIARARRLVVTAVARVQPTDFAWDDAWRREVSNPGRPPLLMEPVRATVTWKRRGTITAHALDNSGHRTAAVKLEQSTEGVKLFIDTAAGTTHWELVVE